MSQTLTAKTLKDTRTESANPTTINGASSTLAATGDSSATTKTTMLLSFDLSSIPQGVTITSATLHLFPSAAPTASTSYDAYELIANYDWTEAQATYNNKNEATVTAWAGGSLGCRVHGTDIGSTIRWTINTSTSDAADHDYSAAFTTSVVQSVADRALQNNDGILHIAITRTGSGSSTGGSFRTKESSGNGGPNGASTPQLVVVYNDPAVSGTASGRSTDAVVFAQCTYTGDNESDETITVKRKLQGAGDGTYVTLVTYYDRTNKIAYAGHNVDFGAGNVTHRGDIGLTAGTTYTYQFTFGSGGGGGGATKTVDLTTLARLDPLAHGGRARVPATMWFWSGSNATVADAIVQNAWIAMTKGEETDVSPSSVASLTSVRSGATDIPIYQYFAVEVRRDLSDATHNLVWRRNTIVFDAALETDFEASYAEDWFLHDGASTMANRIYNGNYSNFWLNLTKTGAMSWVYKAFLQNLYDRQTDATAAAVRFTGVVIDNFEQALDNGLRTTATAGPLTPTETSYDTSTEVKNAYRAMWAFFKATGTYIASNVVNATTAQQIECATLLNGVFIESTVTSYSSGIPGIQYRTGTDWKAHVDTLVTIRDTVSGPDHLLAVIQMGTTPHNDDDVNYCLWSYAMFMDGVGGGKKVVFRPADNTDGGAGTAYDRDEVSYAGTLLAGSYRANAPEYLKAWGAPSATSYVQDTSVGSGDERIYKRVFANGVVWFNPTSGSLSPVGGPTLAARTGQFVPSTGSATKRDRHMPRGIGRGILRGVT